MGKLILHIGTQKTGSTAIQRFLQQNREQLEKDGIAIPNPSTYVNLFEREHYARTYKNHTAYFLLVLVYEKLVGGVDEHVVAQAKNDLIDLAHLVRTHERTIARYERIMLYCMEIKGFWQALKEILESAGIDDVELVAYLRRQDKLAASLWNNRVKDGGECRPFEEWLQLDEVSRLLDYDSQLTEIENVFGANNLNIRIYERDGFEHNDICYDFCRAVGIEETENYAFSQHDPQVSLSLDVVEALRRANDLGLRTGGNNRWIMHAAIRHSRVNPNTNITALMSSDEARALCKRFQKGNRRIARRYFGKDELFDDAFSDVQKWVPDEDRDKTLMLELLGAKADGANRCGFIANDGLEVARPFVPANNHHTFKLINIVFNDNAKQDKEKQLYVRTLHLGESSVSNRGTMLETEYCYQFDTYFNGFPEQLWRRYTCIEDVWLHVSIRGRADFTLYCVGEDKDGKSQRTDFGTGVFANASAFEEVDIKLPKGDAMLVGFELTTSESIEIGECYYFADVPEEHICPVNLLLSSTTYKKERFVFENARLFSTELLTCSDPISGHVTMQYVDNGNTINADELKSYGINLIPNSNTGGAGGFARGMIEALEQDISPTHIILMDDDIRLSAESVKRTFNLLSLLRDEWADAFVGGAMLDYDSPWQQKEDLGYILGMDRKKGLGSYLAIVQGVLTGFVGGWASARGALDMTEVSNIISLSHSLPSYMKTYQAFWYCCIPLSCVRKHGLPLPLFIYGDDIEYSRRCRARFITMNGICVWHKRVRTDPFRDAYYVIRNVLTIAAATESTFPKNLWDICIELVKVEIDAYNYSIASIMMQAMEDYLKGPSYYSERHIEQELARQSMLDKFQPMDDYDISEDLCQQAVIINRSSKSNNQFNLMINAANRVGALSRMLPLPSTALFTDAGEPIVVYAPGKHAYPMNVIQKYKSYIVLDVDHRLAARRSRNITKEKDLQRWLRSIIKRGKKERSAIDTLWRESRDQLVSVEFWKGYLK